jgi:hypothetical protein
MFRGWVDATGDRRIGMFAEDLRESHQKLIQTRDPDHLGQQRPTSLGHHALPGAINLSPAMSMGPL